MNPSQILSNPPTISLYIHSTLLVKFDKNFLLTIKDYIFLAK